MCLKKKVGVARGLEVGEASRKQRVEPQKPSHAGQDGKPSGASEQQSAMSAVWRAGAGGSRQSG